MRTVFVECRLTFRRGLLTIDLDVEFLRIEHALVQIEIAEKRARASIIARIDTLDRCVVPRCPFLRRRKWIFVAIAIRRRFVRVAGERALAIDRPINCETLLFGCFPILSPKSGIACACQGFRLPRIRKDRAIPSRYESAGMSGSLCFANMNGRFVDVGICGGDGPQYRWCFRVDAALRAAFREPDVAANDRNLANARVRTHTCAILERVARFGYAILDGRTEFERVTGSHVRRDRDRYLVGQSAKCERHPRIGRDGTRRSAFDDGLDRQAAWITGNDSGPEPELQGPCELVRRIVGIGISARSEAAVARFESSVPLAGKFFAPVSIELVRKPENHLKHCSPMNRWRRRFKRASIP